MAARSGSVLASSAVIASFTFCISARPCSWAAFDCATAASNIVCCDVLRLRFAFAWAISGPNISSPPPMGPPWPPWPPGPAERLGGRSAGERECERCGRRGDGATRAETFGSGRVAEHGVSFPHQVIERGCRVCREPSVRWTRLSLGVPPRAGSDCNRTLRPRPRVTIGYKRRPIAGSRHRLMPHGRQECPAPHSRRRR